MYHKIYEGEFLSLDAVTWKVSILRDQETAPASVGALDFPGDSPLVIDWQETSKEEVICGSIATVTLLSPGDRTYIDLYTDIPGSVKLEVRRNNVLYWSGTLDPEFYEEPYSSGSDYNVSLSFSDFGILQRLKYNLSGIKTLQQILSDALSRAAISYTSVDTSMISTQLASSTLSLSSVKVRSDNFYDEDGLPSSMHEVVAGMFQPLALRMIQKAGVIWIYDINGLMSCTDTPIEWGSDDQMLSVDKVFNDIKVTLSLYESENASEDFEYKGEVSVEKVNLTREQPEDGDYYSFYPDYNLSQTDYSNIDFTIFQGEEADGLAYKHPGLKYFKVLPVLGSGECEGLRRWFYVGHDSFGTPPAHGNVTRIGLAAGQPSDSTVLIETKPLWLGSLQTPSAKRLRVVQKLFVDARYNPFTDAGDYNEKDNYARLRQVQLLELPAKIELLDDGGNVIYHYTNRSVRDQQFASGAVTVERLLGSWASGPAAYDDCLLRYYNFRDGNIEFLCSGWFGNRQACNPYQQTAYLGASLFAAEDGQYIPYPPSGGRLRVSICAGLKLYTVVDETTEMLSRTRWMLYAAPTVDVVKANLAYEEDEHEDVEYTGVANANAQEDLEIEEICGTMSDPSPTARGLLLDASGVPITQLTRAGRTDTAEQLLIGTLYSQYAERKTVLSGTMMAYAGGLKTFTDARLSDVKMMALSEQENCQMDEIVIRAAEIAADEYTAE